MDQQETIHIGKRLYKGAYIAVTYFYTKKGAHIVWQKCKVFLKTDY